MTSLHVRQVAAAIERDFADYLDLADVKPQGKQNCLLSRGLAALAVQMLTGPATAARGVHVSRHHADRATSVDIDMDTIPNKTRRSDAVLRPTLASAEVVASTSEQDRQIVSILSALIVEWLCDPRRSHRPAHVSPVARSKPTGE
jgi:hypothetical protein